MYEYDVQGTDEREGSPDSTDGGAQQVQNGGLVQVAVLTLYLIYFTISAIQASPSHLALLTGAFCSKPMSALLVRCSHIFCFSFTSTVHYFYGKYVYNVCPQHQCISTSLEYCI